MKNNHKDDTLICHMAANHPHYCCIHALAFSSL